MSAITASVQLGFKRLNPAQMTPPQQPLFANLTKFPV